MLSDTAKSWQVFLTVLDNADQYALATWNTDVFVSVHFEIMEHTVNSHRAII